MAYEGKDDINIREGQIWKFSRRSDYSGNCEITDVNGYGEITGRFVDQIGNEVLGRVDPEDLDYITDHVVY